MRIAAWNIGHKASKKAIHPNLVSAVTALDVEVVTFNEFVDGPGRGAFRAELDDAGFGHQIVSLTRDRHNQILIASKWPMWAGDLQPPQFDGSAISNFLHVVFPASRLELIGLRVPAYEKKRAEMTPYLADLARCLDGAGDRALVVAGDFNLDPFAGFPLGAGPVDWPTCPGLTVHEPGEGWSFSFSDGTGTSRIDHVAASAHVHVDDVRYVTEAGGIPLAGLAADKPVSDHAALVFRAVRA